MSNKVKCECCNGTGKIVCEYCHSEGKKECPDCKGTGKIFSVCPNCHEGRVIDPRGADDDDTMPCPVCHGNYKTANGKCKACGGTGKVDCEDCDGRGKVNCEICEGDGEIDADIFCSSYLGGEEPDLFVSWDGEVMSPAVFSQLETIAKTGHGEACYIVGSCYSTGLSVDANECQEQSENESSQEMTASDFFGAWETKIVCKDVGKAEQYLRASVENGIESAAFKLGNLFLEEYSDEVHRKEGAQLLLRAADNDCLNALLPIAFFNLEGVSGFEKSPANALRYFRRYTELTNEDQESIGFRMANAYVVNLENAEAGDTASMLMLAKMHKKLHLGGAAGEVSNLENVWLEKSAAAGNLEAAKELAQMQKYSNLGNSVQLLDNAAQDGDKAAKEQLEALMLECTKKQSRFDELKKVADSGNVAAMKFIASMYADGKVGKKDTRETTATEWYKKAADAGDGEAMLDLSVRYRDGKGCAKDINRAFVLTVEGFENGGFKRRAIRLAAEFYRCGKFSAPDYKKANALYARSANAGHTASMVMLGKCYAEGLGVKQNLGEAKRLFEMAVVKKSKDAEAELKKIPADVKTGKKPISGVTGVPQKGPLPEFVQEDYRKAKEGRLWSPEFEKKRDAARKTGKPMVAVGAKKRWLFILLGILFAGPGLQFVYAKRWGWWFIHLALLGCAVAIPPVFGAVGLLWIGSLIFMKKDGKGNLMA